MKMPCLCVLILLGGLCPVRAQSLPTARPLVAKSFSNVADKEPLAKVLAELSRQTGLEVDPGTVDVSVPITAAFDKQPFWLVVEQLAEQSASRVAVGRQGVPVRLMSLGKAKREPVSIDGPFRVAATSVDARIDLRTGLTAYDLTLEVAWESRLPVYRIDAAPRIAQGRDDAGRPIRVLPIDARNPVAGVYSPLRVRLEGLTRQSQRIDLLQGTLGATVAEEMLRFRFDLGTPAVKQTKEGVEVSLNRFEKQGTAWLADVVLHYPDTSAAFESFETYWLGRNRFTLIGPDGKTRVVCDDVEINGNSLRYRIKQSDFQPKDLKGWTLEYETPGPMREVPIAFTLKNIPLP